MSIARRAAELAKRHGPRVLREARKQVAKQRLPKRRTPDASNEDPSRGSIPPGEVWSASYATQADGDPDPGEVVWAWVPYEDDPAQGKDRPVLLLGRRGSDWVGLYLTSRDNTRDEAEEARYGRYWMDVGTGGWDRKARPSEVRLDRLIVLPESAIRREGAALPKPMYDQVVARATELGTFES